MPQKIRITRQDILQTALTIVREQGEEAVNARSIAAALSCSTQPVFSNFTSMDELQEAVYAAAFEHYLSCLKQEAENGQYPTYKSYGMAYIRFAKEEKRLFKLLFLCERQDKDRPVSEDFESSVDMIVAANGVSRETAILMHLEIWSFVHGIATMLATSFLDLDQELISDMLSDAYQGIRARHVNKEETT